MTKVDPTPEQIAVRAAKLRESWPKQRLTLSRGGGAVEWQVPVVETDEWMRELTRYLEEFE